MTPLHTIKGIAGAGRGGEEELGEDKVPDVPEPDHTNQIAWWRFVQSHGSKIPRIVEKTNVCHVLQISGSIDAIIGQHLLIGVKGRAQC